MLILAAVVTLTASLTLAQGGKPELAVGTAFTYQGRLTDTSGHPVDDACDFQFSLWNDPDAGSQVGSTQEETGVAVDGGLLTVPLDFGAVFDGPALWLKVAVRCTGDPGYVTLAQRQALTPTPYALNADLLDGINSSNLARVGRYSIAGGGGGGSVAIDIPHYNAFQLTIGEAFGSPQRVGWMSGIENDGDLAWTCIDSTGAVSTGTCDLDATTTIMTLGAGISLKCPGNGNLELTLASDGEDVRAFLVW